MKPNTVKTAKPRTRAAVVHMDLPDKHVISSLRNLKEELAEAVNLTDALDVDIVHEEIISLREINPKALMGKGKCNDLADIVIEKYVDVVVINTSLSPTQQRNLEVALDTKVIDRTHLILEIFADRAHTKAGELQVALAQTIYQQGRLVRAWTHLERQRGGLGKTGGPGERQIELDRRICRDKIKALKEELGHVEKERVQQRQARQKAGLPVISLVGYTNAGKSTLFNALLSMGKDEKVEPAMVKNMLFATLDPLMRKLQLPSGRDVIISDTVGFVSNLPHELVDAFASTLEEVTMADLILHVQDYSSQEHEAQADDVIKVLADIDANEIACINVANKADLIEDKTDIDETSVAISAVTGEGLESLIEAIEAELAKEEVVVELKVNIADGKKLAWLHQNGEILTQDLDGEEWDITARLPKAMAAKI